MSLYPKEVTERAYSKTTETADGHLLWEGTDLRFMFNRTRYHARNVLCGKPAGKGFMWAAECGVPNCVARAHCVLEPAVTRSSRTFGPKHKTCTKCGRTMRAHGALKADFPDTVPQGAGGLCMTCKTHSKTGVPRGGAFVFKSPHMQKLWDKVFQHQDDLTFDLEVVRHRVPKDLWWCFGIGEEQA